MLQVTPNRPWSKDVHPNMPVTPDELLADLRDCFRAGADGVHLHVRDRSGAETFGVKTVVVDLTHPSFIDASGIGALVVGRTAAQTVGVGYRVVGVAGRVRQVLEMANMVDALVDPTWPDCDGETRLNGDQKSAAVGWKTGSDPPRAQRDSNP